MNTLRLLKDKLNRKGSDKLIYLATFVLSTLGIVMIGSASIGSVTSLGTTYALKTMVMQLAFVLGGAFLMVMFAKKFNVKMINRTMCNRLYVIGLGSMCICRLFRGVNGAYAWIRLGPMTIQPAEFMKIILVLIVAFYMTETDGAYVSFGFRSPVEKSAFYKDKFLKCLLQPMALVVLACIVGVVIQKDTGTMIILFLMCFICFMATPRKYYTKYKRMVWVGVGIAGVLFAVLATVVLKSYQLGRFSAWLDPFYDVYNSSYQLVNAMIAFTNGGLFGLGFGNSTQKFGYIPEANNDFIGAIVYEELGMFGLALIVIPTCIIIFKFLSYSAKIKDAKSRVILIGIASYFFLHLIVNLGGVSGYIPMTGVPLLLVSSGGSSSLCSLIAIGIGQSIISRYNKAKLEQ